MTKKRSAPIQPVMVEKTITDYVPDAHNANAGTERGLQMIEQSLNQDGVGRSIVADKNGKIPAGNKTLEAAVNAGITKVLEVTTGGDTLLVHRRADWDLDDPRGAARRYAYRDNRAGQVGLAWDADQIAADVANGVQLDSMFYDWELQKLAGIMPDVPQVPTDLWQGMPEFQNDDIKPFRSLVVHFKSQEALDDFLRLIGQVITDKTKWIFHPKQPYAELKREQMVDTAQEEPPKDSAS